VDSPVKWVIHKLISGFETTDLVMDIPVNVESGL